MGGGDDRDVEVEVGVDERLDGALGPARLADGQGTVDLDQVGFGPALGGEPGGLDLERLAQLVDLEHGGAADARLPLGRRRQRADEGARALTGLELTGVDEHPDRLTDGRATDAELLGELGLGRQPFADRPAAGRELLAQLGDRELAERAAAEGGQRHPPIVQVLRCLCGAG